MYLLNFWSAKSFPLQVYLFCNFLAKQNRSCVIIQCTSPYSCHIHQFLARGRLCVRSPWLHQVLPWRNKRCSRFCQTVPGQETKTQANITITTESGTLYLMTGVATWLLEQYTCTVHMLWLAHAPAVWKLSAFYFLQLTIHSIQTQHVNFSLSHSWPRHPCVLSCVLQSRKSRSRDRTSSQSGDDGLSRIPSGGVSVPVSGANKLHDLEEGGGGAGKNKQKKKKKMQKVVKLPLLNQCWISIVSLVTEWQSLPASMQ